MVAHLLRLKLTLLRNSLRRSTLQLVGLILAGVYGLGMVGLILAGLWGLSWAAPDVIATALTLGGAALLVGWLVIPVLASGLDMTLDPARFTTYAIPMRSLLTGLALSGFLGVPGAVTLLVSVGTALAYWRHPGAAVAAVVCGALGALSCIAASRAITAASTNLAASRRFKDLSGVVVLVPLMFMGPLIGGLASGLSSLEETLPSLARTVGWTPLGAVWAVPSDVARGAYGPAALKFLIAVVTLALLVWAWQACLARALVTPPYAGSKRRSAGKMGFFDRFPGTPTGAVAARCLTYWFRDPRYSAGLLIAPLLPLIFVFAAGQGVTPDVVGPVLGYGAALAVFLVAWSISSDISYDNTAFALHLSAGLSGRADRLGRVLAASVLALPLGLLFAVAGAAVAGRWQALPAMLGLALIAWGAGVGLSSVFSARFIMAVPAPGESPMKSKPGNNLSTVLVQIVGFVGAGALCLPAAGLVLAFLLNEAVLWSWLALLVGAVFGVGYLVLGVRLGAGLYDRRAPELLLAVSTDR